MDQEVIFHYFRQSCSEGSAYSSEVSEVSQNKEKKKKRKAKSKTEPTIKVLIFTRLLGTHQRQ